LALAADPANEGRLIAGTAHADSGIRYWAVIGLLMLDERSPQALQALEERLADEAHDVRALAAWALFKSGHAVEAVRSCLNKLLDEQSYATLLVLNVIDLMNDDLSHYMASVAGAGGDFGGYVNRMKGYFENGKSWDFFGRQTQGGEPAKGMEAWYKSQR